MRSNVTPQFIFSRREVRLDITMQAYLATDGVTFEAVKEQLILLGHDIPDHVIRSFLKDGSTKGMEEAADLGQSDSAEARDGVSLPYLYDPTADQQNRQGSAQSTAIPIESQSWAAGSLDHWDASPASQQGVVGSPGVSYASFLVDLDPSDSHSSAAARRTLDQLEVSCIQSQSEQQTGAAVSDRGKDDESRLEQRDSEAGVYPQEYSLAYNGAHTLNAAGIEVSGGQVCG